MSIKHLHNPSFPRERGISLIELVMFIVIVSIALVGTLLVMNTVTKSSADPLIRKQSLAVAESLLEEVELMPFTFCDPDDPSAVTATSGVGCTGGLNGNNDESRLTLGPETAVSVGGAEGRYADPQFDNVSDYSGFNMNGIRDIINAGVGLPGYSVSMVVAQNAIPVIDASSAIPATESLRITVTVIGPDNLPVVLDGYRMRYSPNAVP